ncbi:SAF domain-containing protein [Petrocella sp. FN5]|uniref:SAF domain-containing protein n=1 Tax=Petrocella sp. FN5 TaxID=3032002 RepID=UPI0023DB2D9C|nr:SAF domain-containing protein [Petrocella sp. FN5]MDF1616894.1 SAF domain-containing protein [Petrocella sp. FN5]
MSIIRQRTKNLLMAGFLGLMISLVLILVLSLIFREEVSEYFASTVGQEQQETLTYPVVVASKPLKKGSILTREDVTLSLMEAEKPISSGYTEVSLLMGKKLLIDIDKNLPLTPPMFMEEALVSKNLRIYEFGFIELPYLLDDADVVDIRIAFPTGQDYIVLAKKPIQSFERSRDQVHVGLIDLALEEEEVLRMSSAMVDTYLTEGTRVYLVKYINPDQQASSIVNYPVNQSVLALYMENPNIFEIPNAEQILSKRHVLEVSLVSLLDEAGVRFFETNMAIPTMTMNPLTPEDMILEDIQINRDSEPSPESLTTTITNESNNTEYNNEKEEDATLSGF